MLKVCVCGDVVVGLWVRECVSLCVGVCANMFLLTQRFDLCMIQVHLEFIETLRIVLQE